MIWIVALIFIIVMAQLLTAKIAAWILLVMLIAWGVIETGWGGDSGNGHLPHKK